MLGSILGNPAISPSLTLLVAAEPKHAPRVSSLLGSAVLHAASLAEALARISQGSIQLVLLRLELRDGDGCSTLERLQAAFPAIPVIVLLDDASAELVEPALRMGAQECLSDAQLAGGLPQAVARVRVRATLAHEQRLSRLLLEATERAATLGGCSTAFAQALKRYLACDVVVIGVESAFGAPPLRAHDGLPEALGTNADLGDALAGAGYSARLQLALPMTGAAPGQLWLADRREGWFSEPLATALGSFVPRLCATLERLSQQAHNTENDARFQAVFEKASLGKGIVSLDGRFLQVNAAFCRLLGYAEEELVGVSTSVVMAPGELEAAQARMRAMRDDAALGAPYERRFIAKDGRIISTLISSVPLHDAAGKVFAYLGDVQDLTSQKQAEVERVRLLERLVQAQKLDAIGSLAGGVAHDFNNLLSVILGCSDFVMQRLDAQDPLVADVMDIKKAGERAATLTRQLLAFGRKQPLRPAVLKLNDVVHGLEAMLRRVIGEDVELVVSLAPDLGSTLVDASQLEQVLMNLVVNARDAMSTGGRIEIETRNLAAGEANALSPHAGQLGNCVCLSITDTGCGMDEEVCARCFEPFFTTKPMGQGSGLGLATVYGIVKQSAGHIQVRSEPGRGSCFQIFFSRCDELTRSEPPPPRQGQNRGETILVVDDEPGLLRVASRSLELEGYTVLTSNSAAAALELCREHPGEIHLVLTDIVMPAASGVSLVEKLSELRPRTRALYMSGHSDALIGQHGLIEQGSRFISKPFAPEVLTRRVREVLDEVGAESQTEVAPG